MQHAHAPAGSLVFSRLHIKYSLDIARDMRILPLACVVGVPAQSSARAPVLSAQVQSHAMPLWGPRRAFGVASAASAPLADPGATPMTAG